jgi:hypothetical protein
MSAHRLSRESESLRVSNKAVREHFDRVSPPESPDERRRTLLREARSELTRFRPRAVDADPCLYAMHSAVSKMLEAMEVGR